MKLPCLKSNPCVYCRQEWWHSVVDHLNLSDPKDRKVYEEAKKHLNPKKYKQTA